MGRLRCDAGETPEAEPYYREGLTKYRRVMGNEHAETLISIDNLGSLLSGQGKSAAAEALLLPGAVIAAARLPTGQAVSLRLTRTIAKVYEDWNAADPSKGYDAKAAEWNANMEAMAKPAEQPASRAK